MPADHAHHFGRRQGGGGTALKPHDSFTVPLCALHHERVHRIGALDGLTPDETEYLFLWFALTSVTAWLGRK